MGIVPPMAATSVHPDSIQLQYLWRGHLQEFGSAGAAILAPDMHSIDRLAGACVSACSESCGAARFGLMRIGWVSTVQVGGAF